MPLTLLMINTPILNLLEAQTFLTFENTTYTIKGLPASLESDSASRITVLESAILSWSLASTTYTTPKIWNEDRIHNKHTVLSGKDQNFEYSTLATDFILFIYLRTKGNNEEKIG